MLVDFSVENYGPFRDRATLSMQATSRKEHPENLIDCSSANMDLLTSALLFGANASGKSFMIRGINALKEMVRDTFPEDIRYRWYEPFELDPQCKDAPVSFRMRFCDGGVLYDYALSFLSDRIVSEELTYYPQKRAKNVFRRYGSDDLFKGNNRKLLRFLNPQSTFLALGAKSNDELCSKVRRMISSLIILGSEDIRSLYLSSCRYVEKDEGKRNMMIGGLQKADFGITDYELIDDSADHYASRDTPSDGQFSLYKDERGDARIAVKHRYGGIGDEGLEAVFDMVAQESVGTKSTFGIMGPLVDCLTNGRTLIIDEFGAHLHPLLTRWIVEQFSSDNNPNGAQLIAVTHDVGLIDTRGLVRRDQIYFTNKSREDGSSELYCLSDFKGTRKDDQILRAYLMGRYEAIPLLSEIGVIHVRKNQLPQ